jgi:hypothetical protein
MTDIHSMVRPSKPYDLYYYDAETSKHQAFATTFNTRYTQDIPNKSGGTSSFILPPQNGYTDIIISATIAGPASSPGAIALPRGWLWALIDTVSFRYGGSSQYFLSGDQLLQNALRAQTSRSSCNDLLTLGGNFATGADLIGTQSASVVLTLPHNHPCGSGKKNPFPSDLLTQQILVQVTLRPLGQIITNATGSALPGVFQTLDTASFTVAQVMLNNQGDALARRVDMSQSVYAYPAEFVQQVVRVPVASSASSQSLVLTGFRAGQVKSLEMWLTRGVDTILGSSTLGDQSANGYNPFNWILPTALRVTYSGEVFANYQSSSAPLWNLVNGNKSSAFDNLTQSIVSSAIVSTSAISQWVCAPFAQPLVDEDAHFIQISGRNITNGIINIDLTTPSAQSDWTLNVSYVYCCTILFSSGTADFVF